MEFHRIKIELLGRDGNAPERVLEQIEKDFVVEEPQRLTRQVSVPGTWVTISIPSGITFKYILIKSTYTEDDFGLGVKKGDLAPSRIRLKGEEFILSDGSGFLTSSIDALDVATDYADNPIKFEIFLG